MKYSDNPKTAALQFANKVRRDFGLSRKTKLRKGIHGIDASSCPIARTINGDGDLVSLVGPCITYVRPNTRTTRVRYVVPATVSTFIRMNDKHNEYELQSTNIKPETGIEELIYGA